jgi:cytidyltransferase-like protein
MNPEQVMAAGGFDDIRSPDVRFLEEAAKLGPLTVWLWPDDVLRRVTGRLPKFPEAERLYFLNAVRYVRRVILAGGSIQPDELPAGRHIRVWADVQRSANPAREEFCRKRHVTYRVFNAEQLHGFPDPPPKPSAPERKKVVVTGCYDWFHSGHVRFLEEVSRCGDLYVVVGNDANIRALKGEGHPLLPQEERRYMAGSIKYVKQALIASGAGWLDADAEIQKLKPDIYAVNEDGDTGGKREYCARYGIKYLVLQRAPAPGLPARTSTALRGF